MRLVVDANIAFSLLKKGSFTRKLAVEHNLELVSHPCIIDELTEHSSELCSKLGVSEERFEKLMDILSRRIVSLAKVSPQQVNRAKPLISDSEDVLYLALAIDSGTDIWSNDPHLKEQSIVKVFTTDELAKELKSEKGWI